MKVTNLDVLLKGSEPTHVQMTSFIPEYDKFVREYTNWGRLEDNKTRKKWLLEFCDQHAKEYVPVVNAIADQWISTESTLARMVTKGVVLSDDHYKHIFRKLEQFRSIVESTKEKKEESKPEPVVEVPKRNTELEDAMTFIHTAIDTYTTTEKINAKFLDAIKELKLSAENHQCVLDSIDETMVEFQQALDDKEVRECYSFSAVKLKRILKFLTDIKDTLVSTREEKQKEKEARLAKKRAIREKNKPVNMDKFRLASSCEKTKITTLDKTGIVGAKLLFIVNMDQQYMMRIESDSGFSATRNTLTNVTRCVKKKIGRRYEEVTVGMRNTSTVRNAEALWKSINAVETEVNPYGSDNSILVFVSR